MIKLGQIYSLTDFQRRTREFVEQVKATQEPLVLTVKGKAELVVQDAQSYQSLLERLEAAETIAGLVKSRAEFEQGQGVPLSAAMQQIRDRYGV